MKTRSVLGFVLLAVLSAACGERRERSLLYFDQVPPGETPTVFAPGVISKEGRYEQFLLYSTQAENLTFGVTDSDWSTFSLYQMTLEEGRWSEASVPAFLGGDPSALTSCVTFDGNRAFFTSARPEYPPADIWMSERRGGEWSEPAKVGPPVSSDGDEFEVVVSRNGTLYFSSTRPGGLGDIDIYRAPLTEGEYRTAENLGPPVNTSAGDDLPFIAPDESYLIFASDRPGGLGDRDLYISFQVDGAWTEPRNLGAPINSPDWEIYPSLSPDGKYLFFTRRKGGFQGVEDSEIYWVGARFIDRLRKTAGVHTR